MSGCEHVNHLNENTNTTLKEKSLVTQVDRAPKTAFNTQNNAADQHNDFVQTPSKIGKVPTLTTSGDAGPNGLSTKKPILGIKKVDAFVAPLALPQFIDVVFGKMLKTPYVTGPEVAAHTDVVQLRSSGEMSSKDFLDLVSSALEDYGVRVIAENGTYKILEDKALRSRIPKFIKSRARLRTPADLRPVIQFVEMRAVSANSMAAFLFQAFGRQNDKIKITANPQENYITLAGLPEDVDAALAVILEMDELRYAGTQVQRYTPRYWKAEELGRELKKALSVEGWQVTDNPNETRTIFVMAVKYSNDIFIFTHSAEALKRSNTWLKELDRPIDGGDTQKIYIYQVRNVDASLLAETANAVIDAREGNGRSGGARTRTERSASSSRDGPDSTGTDKGFGGLRSGMFTVDPLGNRIVFSGTASEYEKLVSLLEQLDTPAPEVLIEVQIAEVTLADNSSFGTQFFVDDIGNNSVNATVNSNGLGLGGSGLTVGILSGNVDATLNAFASNRRVKLLSTPFLTARSGGSSEIQVGTDVPIITSQRAANNQGGGDGATDILQNVAYRKTGVLLTIEPIIFSDNRIDLTITQEVSATIDTANSIVSSPTISNRSISTQLSLEDGETAFLGGLIQETQIKDDKGIPILKDIPFVGQAFSVDKISVDRTELVVLITAYILRGQDDKSRFVDQFSRRIDGFVADDERLMTLLPVKF
jgi:general secretion pathway protein D